MSRSNPNNPGPNSGSILDRPLGKISRNTNPNDTNVVSLSAFAYLFSEIVQYYQNRVGSISELERRLEGSGYGVGLKVLELLAYRTAASNSSNSRSSSTIDYYKREIKLMNTLQFISTTAWKSLFGKVADSLERSIDHADEFMIVDYAPITSTYVSVPADFGGLSVDSYISGIISGILEGSGFPARVTAHSVALEDGEQIPNPFAAGGGGGGPPTSGGGSSGTSAAAYQASYSISELTGAPLLPVRKEKTVFLVKFAPSVLQRDSMMG